MQKRWELTEYDVTEATELHQALKIHPIFCQLLVQRGINNFQDAKRFFRPQLSHLHDPFLMKDMEKAVQRIGQAIIKKENILIYGDYDVDGTTAVALLYRFLSKYHTLLHYYLPDRYKEGYGISTKGIEYAIQENCSLIVALDCGIKAHEAIQFANQNQIDCIVCDHHLPDEQLPNAYAILNPKQADCDYPYKELSGCAIGFKLIEGFAQLYQISFEQNVQPFLDLVAISLACDFVPLTGENRVLAYYGLQQLHQQPRLGIAILLNSFPQKEQYNIRDLVFGIGPHLNAAGRILHANKAVELLIATETVAAKKVAQQLINANQERRDIEHDIIIEAKKMIQQDIAFGEKKAVVLFNENWHKGVIGIVASKMVESYHKPSIIFTLSNGRIVGSARSVHGFDIYQAIAQCEDLLVNYGGHKYAAGLTLKPIHLEDFIQRFQTIVDQSISPNLEQPTQYIDAAIEFEHINEKFWQLLQQFAPFGPQNMRPVFISKHLKDTGYSKLLKNQHLKLVIQQKEGSTMEGIAFGLGQHFSNLQAQKLFELCYVLEENTFRGRSKLQLNVKAMRFRS
ncbi:single-stranded-DNA-specific exonuclease RecJ [Aureispira anguillae]|uniref:Single-stranded-DNA-specific exonuclease RecJ n=1 Tax=Aureispira anguillae TaxID=2864201 RepID=A0A915YKN4_9BACT|nr:single-stranded-DNA-specific exonuclease RecJ [Aureispira anguillae]BDS14968.1 single-stranded-DNA-specific exonuclease RecJ [Aureispira anguillae]